MTLCGQAKVSNNLQSYFKYCFKITVEDAYGSIPIFARLEGNRWSRGAYDSCMEVEENHFRGQYCNLVSRLVPSVLFPDSSAVESLNPLLPPEEAASNGLISVICYDSNMSFHLLLVNTDGH